MTPVRARIPTRLSDSILWRPVVFVAAGVGLASMMLALDSALGPSALPSWLRFGGENARLLFATLAGALLTVAGITFWVRSASVALAAGQYSANVVMGFLEDWFQQSVMSLMLGLFAYVVAVFRVLEPGVDGARVPVPHLSVLLGIVLAASSVVFVMAAIRNAVRTMYAGALGRRISDLTVARVRQTFPLVDGEPPDAGVEAPRTSPPVRVRAVTSGWVTDIDEDALLGVLPAGAVVHLDVRVGLYALEGRSLAQVWADDAGTEQVSHAVRSAVHLGRRSASHDIEFGLSQLVDLGVGSLVGHAADVTSAYEVTQHLELVLWELGRRGLRPRATTDDRGRTVIRGRHITYEDYVRLAFERLRRAAVGYPTIAGALIVSASDVARDLEGTGFPRRGAALRRQVGIILDAVEATDMVEDDKATLRRLAGPSHRVGR